MLKADVEVDRREFTLRAAISVAPGERLALFGPSGAGKTTLLEAIAGLVHPKTGTVELAGRTLTRTAGPKIAIPPWRRQVGLLRQDPGLFPHLSVRGNLGYARNADPQGAELTGLAEALGLGDLLAAMPARLSGGQQHRVALARLLLAHCDALLLDEPYSGLDAVLRRTLTALVVRLVTERGVPAVLVAHELADAQAFASQMAVLDRGSVLQLGDPDRVVLEPASDRVAELVGYLGFVNVAGRPGIVAGIHPDRVVTGARPGRGIVLTGTVAASRPAGAGWEVDLLLPDGVVTGPVPGNGLVSGTSVTFRLADRPGPPGSGLVVTAIDPPCFGPDGAAMERQAASPRISPGEFASRAPAGWGGQP